MLVLHEQFESGWIGISMALTPDEIGYLAERLSQLSAGKIDHFHIGRSEFSAKIGIVDIEISLQGADDSDNMQIE